jgi:prolyl-tRNA editing enzyme YbaK/EbsC (Cys-tRNA(Pro) deacylase)
MAYHPVSQRIIDCLTQNNCWFETFEHGPTRTSLESAAMRDGYELHQGAKAILIAAKAKDGGRKIFMFVFPADLFFDKRAIRDIVGTRDFRFARDDEVFQVTDGVLPGGIPPFGHLFGLDVFADPLLFENERIVFNAGDRCFSVAMLSSDYQRLAKPKIVKFTSREI